MFSAALLLAPGRFQKTLRARAREEGVKKARHVISAGAH